MIRDPLSSIRRVMPLAAVLLLAMAGAAGAQEEPPPCPAFPPYVFVLMDTSGSLNYSPACTQTQLDNGDCPFLCPTGDCFVPLQGDDPASKFFQMKAGLYTVLNAQPYVQFGFATFNQDSFYTRAKHWVYEAQGNGPLLPGGPYPAAGAQEVFGNLWACDTGSLDNEIGCVSSKPADLPDAWELTRVQRLPKGGKLFNQPMTFYIRQAPPTVYKVTYTPTAGGPLGNSTVLTNVRIDKCNNTACSSITLIGQQTVTWSRVADFLPWDNADTTNTNRINPQITYFGQYDSTDAQAGSTCIGWDSNTDTTYDKFNNYTLRWPTDTTDPRGIALTKGDVIPWDWQQDHNVHIQMRLAPNLSGFPGTPDFRIATYLRDLPQGADAFLRLKDETKRPLIAVGSTPLANSLQTFRTWYVNWRNIATAQDLDWSCRKRILILLTDGDDTCGVSPCSVAGNLWEQYGVQVYPVGFGADPLASTQLDCIGYNGGSGEPSRPQTLQELIDSLNAIVDAAKVP